MKNVIVTLDELAKVSLPEKTSSYTPVPHVELIDLIYEVADKVGFRPAREEFRAARGGNLISGKLIFVGDEEGIDMQVGLVNSYDKSRSAMLGIGAEVFICLNGAMSADYQMRRKHTTNVWRDLEQMVIDSINNLYLEYRSIINTKERLNSIDYSKRRQSELLGRIFVEEEIVTPVMANIIRKEILESTMHPDDTAWSFYNHVTYALRQAHPTQYIEKHVQFHKFITQHFN